ncbi:MAG: ubiquinol-cytochrome C chaperone family protein [Azospirillaceae bacterium]|nr:ubiquinol-cytochrome C chaperone family protein [Azospirillaceae bacterium]
MPARNSIDGTDPEPYVRGHNRIARIVLSMSSAGAAVPFRLFHRQSVPDAVLRGYDRLVAQARLPGFYRDVGVPDSVDGRFELIVLHVYLLAERLRGQGRPADAFAQALMNRLVSDMDASLREMGISDLRVPREIKAMVVALRGRLVAYRQGMAAPDDRLLYDALDRNLFGTSEPAAGALAQMSAYVRREAAALAAQPLAVLLTGDIAFGGAPGGDAAAVDDTGAFCSA